MKISTKGRYAIRLMLDLAQHTDDGCVSIKTIATRQGISEKYLEQIIKSLSANGLVESTRGKQGGYRLTRTPAEYTVGEILRVTEGSLAPVSCLEEDHHCENCEDCVTFEIWQNVLDAINEVVDSITLAYLVEKQKTKKSCCNKG
ncbi:MAG TPA: Rrf2 family transcriptional regulator [Candidatus Fimenecus excrementavium]|jgi:Rrf2 family protein|nr:Rrf2 family transcriptional regulator [Candidatus Fimenecus excrementavium]